MGVKIRMCEDEDQCEGVRMEVDGEEEMDCAGSGVGKDAIRKVDIDKRLSIGWGGRRDSVKRMRMAKSSEDVSEEGGVREREHREEACGA